METLKQGEIKVVQDSQTSVTTVSASQTTATAVRGLETKNVHAWFGKHHVLSDVSLQFPERTVTGLIGPSGCGKSTFIRTLDRMHELIPGAQLSGEVLFNGKDIYGPAVDPISVRLGIGMVFQNFALMELQNHY